MAQVYAKRNGHRTQQLKTITIFMQITSGIGHQTINKNISLAVFGISISIFNINNPMNPMCFVIVDIFILADHLPAPGTLHRYDPRFMCEILTRENNKVSDAMWPGGVGACALVQTWSLSMSNGLLMMHSFCCELNAFHIHFIIIVYCANGRKKWTCILGSEWKKLLFSHCFMRDRFSLTLWRPILSV